MRNSAEKNIACAVSGRDALRPVLVSSISARQLVIITLYLGLRQTVPGLAAKIVPSVPYRKVLPRPRSERFHILRQYNRHFLNGNVF